MSTLYRLAMSRDIPAAVRESCPRGTWGRTIAAARAERARINEVRAKRRSCSATASRASRTPRAEISPSDAGSATTRTAVLLAPTDPLAEQTTLT